MSKRRLALTVTGIVLLALLVGIGVVSPKLSSAGTFPFDRYVLANGDACSDFADQFAGKPQIHPGVCGGGTWLYETAKMVQVGNDTIWDEFFLAGDWDKDDCDDVFGLKGGALTLFTLNCNGGLISTTQLVGDFSGYNYFTSVGMWDGDFNPDFVARRTSDSALVLFKGDGGHSLLGDPVDIGTRWDAGDIIMGVGDFDHDLCSDIIVRRMDTHALRLYTGDCLGGFKAGDLAIVGGEDGFADFDWLFAGGDWLTGDNNHCPDIGGWKQSDPDNLYFFAGNCAGSINLPAVLVNRSAGWNYPAVTDSTHPFIWGDIDCKGGNADPVDALKILKLDAGLPVNQTVGCRDFGKKVLVTTDLNITWADVDCDGTVNQVDALKALLADAGRPPAQTVPDCPAFGSTFNQEWLAQID